MRYNFDDVLLEAGEFAQFHDFPYGISEITIYRKSTIPSNKESSINKEEGEVDSKRTEHRKKESARTTRETSGRNKNRQQ